MNFVGRYVRTRGLMSGERREEEEARNVQGSLLRIRLIFPCLPGGHRDASWRSYPAGTRYAMFRNFRDEPPNFDVEPLRKAPASAAKNPDYSV